MSDFIQIKKDDSADILKLHILYLEKVNILSKGERAAFEKYLHHLSCPEIIINQEFIKP